MTTEIRQIWQWACRHERAPLLVPLIIVMAAATVADLALVADYLRDYSQDIHGMGTSPVEAVLGPDFPPLLSPLVLAFLMLGIPGTFYVGILLIVPPLIWAARIIGR